MSTKFFTNQGGNSLLKKFEGVFNNIDSIWHFDALVGYFRTSGYFKVRAFLDKIPKIRILVGINVDQLIKKYHDRGQLYLENPEETKADFMASVVKNIQEADYNETIEKGIIQFLEDLISGKIELRAHPRQKIHAKVYIFRPANFNEHSHCEVITGSSNLTDAGLGAHPESNYEFNVSLRDYDDVKFATDEFERLWEESVPILHAEAEAIRKRTYLRDDFTPFELYLKMLMEYFGKRVEYDPYSIETLLPEKYMRLKYQSDAANQGYAVMMKHNGFILADVVGLGKTIIACMIIRKFIYENGTHSRVLVVVPPALVDNWRRTTEDFQIKNNFEFITLGSLDKVIREDNYTHSNADKFDLVVVDESHKFRNDHTDMYVALQEICKKPRSRPAENGDTRKKVILISATPLNNRPQDIENQLYLFQDKRNSTLESVPKRDLQAYFKPINDAYKKLATEKELDIKGLKRVFQKLRDDVIEPLVIRRTRTDIDNIDDYREDLKNQGISFPKLDDPISLYYQLDGKLAKLFYETVSVITGLDENGNEVEGLGYYRYRAIEFLANEEDRRIYGNVGSISKRLSSIMKTLLVKRLESSFHAFRESINRFSKAVHNMVGMFEKDQVFIAPDFDINKLLEEGMDYDEIVEKINAREEGNNRVFSRSAFSKDFIDKLNADKEKVDMLALRWSKVNLENDPKLKAFSEQIQTEFFKNERHNPGGQLVIFSESVETARDLSEYLTNNFPYKVLTIDAGNRKEMEPVIRANFDANLEEEKWQHEYQIIITTEVLAEGINLHRSNLIVNYDVPWNATRLMQRIGRVNRIGSKAEQIFVYNFYPSAHGDEQIRLVNNALRKLQAFHTAFGEDNRVFSLLEEKSEGSLLAPQIQREESEILKYLNELREFKKKQPERYAEIAKIPGKARCGRSVDNVAELVLTDVDKGGTVYPLHNASITYLKSENHPGIFCLITPEYNTVELNFLQAAKVYKAAETENSVPRHELHYKQAAKGLEHFQSEKNQTVVQAVSRRNLSSIENKTITYLNEAKKHAATEQKRTALQRAIDLVKKGTYGSKGLPKSVNDFFAKNIRTLGKDASGFVDQLFVQLLDGYDLSANVETNETGPSGYGIINPTIVLTQSFV